MKLTQWEKHDGERPRLVVITQGENPTVVAHKGAVSEHPIIPISPDHIVDTNGAGDAFGMFVRVFVQINFYQLYLTVGGFLSQLVLGKSLEHSLRAGNHMANLIIQQSGASLPAVEKPRFE